MAARSAREFGQGCAMIRRLTAHPSARACLLLLCGYAFCGLAELICTLTGAPAK